MWRFSDWLSRKFQATEGGKAKSLLEPENTHVVPSLQNAPMANVVYVLLRRLRSPLIVLVLVYAISVLGFVLIPGVDDQGRPWRMGFFHAFYFVSFMGSTIGFGEIPFAFTDAQRMWAIVAIYATVISWLYGIGASLAAVQDPAFRKLFTVNVFRRSVNRITEPFYLICGYGDTGSILVQAMAEEGIRAVVVDSDESRINSLRLKDLPLPVPGLVAECNRPEVLLQAGLAHPYCKGVIALTNDDHINLKIAITTRLLRPKLNSIVRAETAKEAANISSFGANEIINPWDIFAGRLALSMHSPGMYALFEWMTGVPHDHLQEPLFPPRGRWILCSYGRFGKAVYDRLIGAGIEPIVVEANPIDTDAPDGFIKGRGTEAKTLLQAGIKGAVGIVAGTDDDADNLSIIMTAREQNRKLFMVIRQNKRRNDAIFDKAEVDLIMRRGSVIAHKIFAFIRTPLIGDFLRLAMQHDNDWANVLVSRISALVKEEVPLLWEMEVGQKHTPAVCQMLAETDVTISSLRRNPRDRDEFLSCIPLLVKRGYQEHLLPSSDFLIREDDKILYCGAEGVERKMEWAAGNLDVLRYVATGKEHPSSYLWQWISKMQQKRQQSAKQER